MLTVLNEPKLVQSYNTEYYRLINFYSNVKRPSAFIKYYNLATDISPHDKITAETYDSYIKTNNVWDVYDITPTQIISAIQNTPEQIPDLKGQMIISTTTILTYTIDSPKIGDLVTFYKPVESDEVLRVTNVRLQLNSNYSSEPVKWYELDLESAPIQFDELDQLIKRNHYVYDLSVENNIEYAFYKKYVEAMNRLRELLVFFNQYYIAEKDLYCIHNNIFCETNELIYYIKKEFNNKYIRLFETIKSPLGYWDRYCPFIYNSLDDINIVNEFNIIDYYDETRRKIDYKYFVINSEEEIFLDKTKKLLETILEMREYLTHVRSN